MAEVGARFERAEFCVPERLTAAPAMQAVWRCAGRIWRTTECCWAPESGSARLTTTMKNMRLRIERWGEEECDQAGGEPA